MSIINYYTLFFLDPIIVTTFARCSLRIWPSLALPRPSSTASHPAVFGRFLTSSTRANSPSLWIRSPKLSAPQRIYRFGMIYTFCFSFRPVICCAVIHALGGFRVRPLTRTGKKDCRYLLLLLLPRHALHSSSFKSTPLKLIILSESKTSRPILYLQVLDVTRMCTTYLKRHLGLDNCVDVLALAELYSLSRLRDQCIQYLCLHLPDFISEGRGTCAVYCQCLYFLATFLS